MPGISTTLKVDSIGRVIIPKHIRAALDISPGDLVKVTVEKETMGLGEEQGNAEALPVFT